MAQGRGSAMLGVKAIGLITLICFMMFCDVAESANTYTVGDSIGWTFNTVNWTRGKRFRAGDVLVFKYDPRAHDLVSVNAAGYKSCTAPRGSKMYKSGSDRIKIRRGTNFFICSLPGHCGAGMKVAVTAV